jgi:hypothetical protein
MDVVLESKDERAEGACNAESNTFGIIFEASTHTPYKVQLAGLACTVELFSRTLRQLRTLIFTRLAVLFVLMDGRAKNGGVPEKKWGRHGDGPRINEKAAIAN